MHKHKRNRGPGKQYQTWAATYNRTRSAWRTQRESHFDTLKYSSNEWCESPVTKSPGMKFAHKDKERTSLSSAWALAVRSNIRLSVPMDWKVSTTNTRNVEGRQQAVPFCLSSLVLVFLQNPPPPVLPSVWCGVAIIVTFGHNVPRNGARISVCVFLAGITSIDWIVLEYQTQPAVKARWQIHVYKNTLVPGTLSSITAPMSLLTAPFLTTINAKCLRWFTFRILTRQNQWEETLNLLQNNTLCWGWTSKQYLHKS